MKGSKANGRSPSPVEERLKGEKFVGVYNHEEQKKIREEEQIAIDKCAKIIYKNLTFNVIKKGVRNLRRNNLIR